MRKLIISSTLALGVLSFTYSCADTANTDSSNYDTTQRQMPNTDGTTTPGTGGMDTSVTTGGNIGNERDASSGNQDTVTTTGTGTQGGRDTL